jgi:uncharacterized membrane protein
VPLSVGKNKIQLIATLGDKTITRNLSYTRTAPVTAIGAAMMITYIGTSIVIFVLVILVIVMLIRRRSKREREERDRLREQAPYHV